MKKLIKFLTVISVVFSSAVFAHVHLEKSVPADNAMLMNTSRRVNFGVHQRGTCCKSFIGQ